MVGGTACASIRFRFGWLANRAMDRGEAYQEIESYTLAARSFDQAVRLFTLSIYWSYAALGFFGGTLLIILLGDVT